MFNKETALYALSGANPDEALTAISEYMTTEKLMLSCVKFEIANKFRDALAREEEDPEAYAEACREFAEAAMSVRR